MQSTLHSSWHEQPLSADCCQLALHVHCRFKSFHVRFYWRSPRNFFHVNYIYQHLSWYTLKLKDWELFVHLKIIILLHVSINILQELRVTILSRIATLTPKWEERCYPRPLLFLVNIFNAWLWQKLDFGICACHNVLKLLEKFTHEKNESEKGKWSHVIKMGVVGNC